MRQKIIKIFIGVLLFVLGIVFLYSPGTYDMTAFERWANNADKYGLIEGFNQNKDNYPPLASVIIYISCQISNPFDLNKFEAIKISIFSFLLISSFVFWLYTRSFWLAVILYVSLFLNSVMQGYIDIFIVPTLVLSLWALDKNKLTLFTIAFMITCLIKWQGLIVVPFLIVYLLNIQFIKEWRKINFKNLFKNVLIPGSIVLIFVVLIFNFYVIRDSLFMGLTHKHLSGFALNINWMLTYILRLVNPAKFGVLTSETWSMIIKTDELEITLIPRLIFIVTYSAILFKFFRGEKTFENLLLYIVLGYFSYFLFNVGVHENHLFLIVVISVLLLWLNAKHLMLAVGIIFMFNINLWIFCGFDGTGLAFNRYIWPLSFMLSFLNLVLFTILISHYFFNFKILTKMKGHIPIQIINHQIHLIKRKMIK